MQLRLKQSTPTIDKFHCWQRTSHCLQLQNGWKTAVFYAGIATSGVADSLLKAIHVTKTRYAHQIIAASLSILQHDAYDRYKETMLAREN